MFAGLQTSSDKALQSLGQSGFNSLQIESIAILVSKLNATTAEVRKSAGAELARDYKSSSQAIELVLRMYDPDKIASLSLDGLINGIYFLAATDPTAWDSPHIDAPKVVVSRIESRGVLGPTQKQLWINSNHFCSQ